MEEEKKVESATPSGELPVPKVIQNTSSPLQATEILKPLPPTVLPESITKAPEEVAAIDPHEARE
jgi:hypothetical protein